MPAYHVRLGRTTHESLVIRVIATDYATAEKNAALLLVKAQKSGDRFADHHETRWFHEHEDIEVVVIEEA